VIIDTKHSVQFCTMMLVLALLIPGELDGSDRFRIPPLSEFISDTLFIHLPQDSSDSSHPTQLVVTDERSLEGAIIGIRQTTRLKYIPVDQYLALPQSLSQVFQSQFARDSIQQTGRLNIGELILWQDNSAYGQKGLCLSAYTTLHDTLGQPLSDWIWELRVKKEKKEADTLYLGRVIQAFAAAQSQALKRQDFRSSFYPYLFRRQLMAWSEMILFQDGYAINAHFTLDFPPDQQEKWIRGTPGLYYRRSSQHESIAIGGIDQHRYQRLNHTWITQFSGTFRFGFNNFRRGGFTHLAYQNLLFLNLSTQVSLEYRPVYHRGLYGGLGLYAGYNILPDVIPQFERGALVRVGVLLP